MKLRKDGDIISVWETGSKDNRELYNSEKDIKQYNRRTLSFVELFLKKEKEFEEAKKVKAHIGKMLRISEVPQLIPTGHYVIDSSLDYLEGTINGYIEDFGLDLDPDFQRAHVWSMEQRVRYIEFILQGGKTPPIWFNAPDWGFKFDKGMVIVDGKQRLTSLLMFLNNEFAVFKNLDNYDGTGFFRKDFDYLGVSVKLGINSLKTRKKVLEWYLQMNKGHIAHTDEEIGKVEEILKML